MSDEKRELPEAVENDIGGIQGEQDDLPDPAAVNALAADAGGDTTTADTSKVDGSLVEAPPHPDESKRAE